MRLVYFNARGRAEAIRLLLADAGAEYEDRRIDATAQVKDFDPPFGQLPILQVNEVGDGEGLCLAQSSAILRYLGHRLNYSGGASIESQAKADMIICAVEDVKMRFATSLAAGTHLLNVAASQVKENGNKTLVESSIPADFRDHVLPKWAHYFEKLLGERDDGTVGFCDQLSIAEFAVFDLFDFLQTAQKNSGQPILNWAEYPKLRKLIVYMESRPKVAEWLRNRPLTAV